MERSFSMSCVPDFDLTMLTDCECVKAKLVMQVVSAETNAKKLENIPHKNMEDMVAVHRVMVDENEDECDSVVAANNLMEQYGITLEQLH